MSETLFVSGASGQLGQSVVRHLLERGARVIAGSRNPEGLAEWVAAGAEARRIDFTDPDSVTSALAGVDRALLISIDAVGQRREPQIAAVKAAAAAGVKHLVYTSVASADVPGMALSDEHIATEAAIREHFGSYSILRNNLYAELLLQAIEPAVARGQLVTARGAGRIAWVSREDCARAAAAALADDFTGTRILDIAGPQSLSGDETAVVFSEVAGKPVTHLSVPPEALQEGLEAAGVPAPMAGLLVAFDISASKGWLDRSADDFRALTGASGTTVQAVLAAAQGR